MKIVLAHGCFDIFHYGHLRHLQAAAKFGDYLVVSVTAAEFVNKGEGRPVFNDHQRMEILRSLRFVDQVELSKAETPDKVIKRWKPHVYVKGAEYRDNLPERDLVESFRGRVVFTNEVVYSSTALCSAL